MSKILIDQSTVEQALDALEAHTDIGIKSDKVITALRAALEQPVEQEPVAWCSQAVPVWGSHQSEKVEKLTRKAQPEYGFTVPLYTHTQQPRQPLTDEQIHEAAIKANGEGKLSWTGFQLDNNGEYTIPLLSLCHYQLARAIECAHGIGK